jgi:hypothetical protein
MTRRSAISITLSGLRTRRPAPHDQDHHPNRPRLSKPRRSLPARIVWETLHQDCHVWPTVALNYLLQLPAASLVEGHRQTFVSDPQLPVALVGCPFLEMRKEPSSQTCASAVRTNDHTQQPRRSVMSFLNVKLAQAYGSQRAAAVTRHPGEGKAPPASFAFRCRPPPSAISRFGWAAPLKPTHVRHGIYKIGAVG